MRERKGTMIGTINANRLFEKTGKTDKHSIRLTRENELKLLNQEQEVTLSLTFQK